MVPLWAEGRERAQSTPQRWETLLWWDGTHGQRRRDTWSFLAALSHPRLPCSALAPSVWLGTESSDCSFWSTIYMTWMKSQTQRVFPLTPANTSPHLPVSDGVSSVAAGVVPLLTAAVSSSHLLGFFPCLLGKNQENTGRKYLSGLKRTPGKLWAWGSAPRPALPPSHHTVLCERAQLWSSKISQRWQGRTFWGTMLVTLVWVGGFQMKQRKTLHGKLLTS